MPTKSRIVAALGMFITAVITTYIFVESEELVQFSTGFIVVTSLIATWVGWRRVGTLTFMSRSRFFKVISSAVVACLVLWLILAVGAALYEVRYNLSWHRYKDPFTVPPDFLRLVATYIYYFTAMPYVAIWAPGGLITGLLCYRTRRYLALN